jgi:hypothetical protein
MKNPAEIMSGMVYSIDGENVRTLVSHGINGHERTYCDFPNSFWPPDAPPQVFQKVNIKWHPNSEIPSIIVDQEDNTFAQHQAVFMDEAERFLGIMRNDKVLIVVGPNPDHAIAQSGSVQYWLVNAGWGEALALTRLPLMLTSIGITPSNIKTKICEADIGSFNPADYSDCHIFFLGSINSNVILRKFYWLNDHPGWRMLNKRYVFSQGPTSLVVLKNNGEVEATYETKDNTNDLNGPNWEKVDVTDHFLLAKVSNPYSTNSRYKCFLCCGAGTIGTGYAAVTLTARDSVNKILDFSEGNDFDVVGRIEMKGFFNPDNDPVTIIRFGNELIDEQVLQHALKSVAT